MSGGKIALVVLAILLLILGGCFRQRTGHDRWLTQRHLIRHGAIVFADRRCNSFFGGAGRPVRNPPLLRCRGHRRHFDGHHRLLDWWRRIFSARLHRTSNFGADYPRPMAENEKDLKGPAALACLCQPFEGTCVSGDDAFPP
jgi:hypothetical protein